ncbi:hypothetical protein [Micromonospora sp. LOL_023]|uniref:hypothetical protein n=1 Tax=Micromonospora sp. LOL_023 TaxID=3345418 RepID=UPI003A89240C
MRRDDLITALQARRGNLVTVRVRDYTIPVTHVGYDPGRDQIVLHLDQTAVSDVLTIITQDRAGATSRPHDDPHPASGPTRQKPHRTPHTEQ